jgi:hypothetical protein
MKRSELNDIEQKVSDDISTHPGDSLSQIIKRMSREYRSETYIRNVILRLETRRYVRIERYGNRTSVFSLVTPPPPL